MIRFIAGLVLTALLSFAGALFFDWWIIAIAAFIVSLVVGQRPFASFLAGFVALALLWGIHSAIIDEQNNHLLATRVAGIFSLNGYVPVIIITSLIAGVVAGFAALSASYLRAPRPKNVTD